MGAQRVFAVGIGRPDGPHGDRKEVLGITAGDPRSIMTVVCDAVSSGFGRTPFSLRACSANGQVLSRGALVPPASVKLAVDRVFTVSRPIR